MTLLTILGSSGTPTFAPQLFGLSIAPYVNCIHLFQSQYKIGSSLQNLAAIGASPSLIVGAPTITTSSLTVNTAGTDFVTTPFLDTGGDFTFYGVIQNQDTIASNTNSPVIVSNYATDPARPPLSGASRGISFRANANTTMALIDIEYISGGSTAKQANVSPTNILTAAKMYAATIATVGSTVTLTVYDLTDNTSNVNAVTGVTQRAWNSTQLLTLFANGNGSAYGKCTAWFYAMAQSAAGLGGAHTAAQIAQNAVGIRAAMAALPVPVIV